jgi:hypothetical protein
VVQAAPGEQGVDEAVARVLDLVVGEAQPAPVVRIVRQPQIEAQRLAGDAARLAGIRL